jgi:hypothetical protein
MKKKKKKKKIGKLQQAVTKFTTHKLHFKSRAYFVLRDRIEFVYELTTWVAGANGVRAPNPFELPRDLLR